MRVVVPGKSDVKLVQWATRHLCRRLLARGILIYERKDFMLHSKVIVIDGERTVVGSCESRSAQFANQSRICRRDFFAGNGRRRDPFLSSRNPAQPSSPSQ